MQIAEGIEIWNANVTALISLAKAEGQIDADEDPDLLAALFINCCSAWAPARASRRPRTCTTSRQAPGCRMVVTDRTGIHPGSVEHHQVSAVRRCPGGEWRADSRRLDSRRGRRLRQHPEWRAVPESVEKEMRLREAAEQAVVDRVLLQAGSPQGSPPPGRRLSGSRC